MLHTWLPMDFLGISFITVVRKHCNLLDGHSLNNRNSKVEKEDNKEMLWVDAKISLLVISGILL